MIFLIFDFFIFFSEFFIFNYLNIFHTNNNNNNIDKNSFNKIVKSIHHSRNNSIVEPNGDLFPKSIRFKKKLIFSEKEKEIKIIIPKKKLNSQSNVRRHISRTPKHILINNSNLNDTESFSTKNADYKRKIQFNNFSKISLTFNNNNISNNNITNNNVNNNVNNNNNNDSISNSPKTLISKNKTFNYESNDPLLIAEEDKIFDLFQIYKKPKIESRKKIKIQKPQNQKKKIISKNPFKKILNNVYKEDEKVIFKINSLKKKKEEINLRKYQEKLLNTVSPTLTKDARKKLGKSFYNLRKKNQIIYKSDYYYLKNMEEIEKNIIRNVNNNQKKFIKLMTSSDESNEGFLKNNSLKLPNIKFKKIIRKNRFSLSPIY